MGRVQERDWVAEANDTEEALKAALHAVGIILPSLRIDPASQGADGPRLIDLGRCNIGVAQKLTEALKKAAE
ncbi:hypothetical protein [Streptomyces sp. NPDC101249]|uniref:hypothetical protein n=1 Tax=Streptomyces sp. NPDC101249 TaxID=3366140 RepID=UPI003814BC42